MIRPPLLHLARCAVAAAIVINPPARTERKPIINVETRNTAQAFTRREAGVYAGDAAVARFVARTPGLRSWAGWFKSPAYLKNGHAHTIFAAKFRWTASVVYRRHLLTTSDGGSLALDILEGFGPGTPDEDAHRTIEALRLAFSDGLDTIGDGADGAVAKLLDPARVAGHRALLREGRALGGANGPHLSLIHI